MFSSIYKVGKYLLLTLFIATLLPINNLADLSVRALAASDEEASLGTINVNLYDQNYEDCGGDWYLHQGTTIKGLIKRNGISDETFDIENGVYFLEVRKIWETHPFYLVHSDNPQTLEAEGDVTYNVQYFETEEQMLARMDAGDQPPAPEPTPEPDPEIDEPEPEPEPVVDSEPVEPVVVVDPADSRTYMGPEGTHPPAAPAPAPTAYVVEEFSTPPALAQTGAPALILLIGSAIFGGLIARKRK